MRLSVHRRSIVIDFINQQQTLAYPEAAWVAKCGNSFPSHTQWLYKTLNKVEVYTPRADPEEIILARSVSLEDSDSGFFGDYTNYTGVVLGDKVTLGSGTTCTGIPIQEHVGIDWVKWAISKNVWNLLYGKDKVNATNKGVDLVLNSVKEVLEVAVSEEIFTNYKIMSTNLDSKNNSLSIVFRAEVSSTILFVNVGGSLYH